MSSGAKMFSNAQYTNISGGNFVQHNTSISRSNSIPTLSGNGREVLLQHSAPAAHLNAKERFDPPKCDPDTRVAIIQRIRDWVTSDDQAASIMWLHGSAGSGKSALAQSIAELCQNDEELAASFFFSRTTHGNRSDGNKLIPTLAYQLTSSFRGVRTRITQIIEKEPTILQQSNSVQMRKLIIGPVNVAMIKSWRAHVRTMIGVERKRPRLIVIDGLDECLDPDIQCDLLRIIGDSIAPLRYPFRFLITSRPEAHISHTFKNDPVFQDVDFREINLLEDEDADQDIRTYFQKEFKKITQFHPWRARIPTNWPSEEALDSLVEKASAQFIYAATVVKYIRSIKYIPIGRLDIVLGLLPTPENESPYPQLDALYHHIFSSVGDRHRVMQIFGVLVIQRTSNDELGSYTSPEMIELLLPFMFQEGEVELILAELRSIISWTPKDLGCPQAAIKLLHASLSDFLLDRSRSGEFFVDVKAQHEVLARSYLRLIRESESNVSPLTDTLLEKYLTAALAHAEKSSFSENLQNELKCFNILRLFRNHDYPRLSDWSELITWQANDLRRKWYKKNGWKVAMVIKFAHILLNKNVRNGEKAFKFHMKKAEEYFWLDTNVMDALMLLLKHPRFQKCSAMHPNCEDKPCSMQRNPQAQILLHRTVFMLILHQESANFSPGPAISNEKTSLSYDTEGLHLKLISSIFYESDGGVDSAVASDFLGSYPTLALDCAAALLGQVYRYSEGLVLILLEKTFPMERARNLKSDIIKYLKRVEYHIETERLKMLKEKWEYE